ncbi:APC family permease [Haloplanus salilacus]|uniref:APC family permease n=1 Tax=Haloplanus salilacus TaxID=2949994 RepID=UPI0030CAD8C6
MSRAGPLGLRHVLAVSLSLPLGAGVFVVPRGVENLGGPGTPAAYLVATLAVCAVGVPHAIFLSSPLAEREGVVYFAVSRTWGSRPLGFLAAWPAVGAYAAVLAALVTALGRTLAPAVPTAAALAVLVVVVAVHALGPAVAGRIQLWTVGALLALLVGMVVAGLTALAPANFSPLFPTPTLRNAPLRSLGAATVATLVGFAGFEGGVALAASTREPRRTVPRAVLSGILLAGAVAAVAAFVALGVIPWSRLVFATAPFTEAAASALGVAPQSLLVPGVTLATASAALATVWRPTSTIRGLGDVVSGIDRATRSGLPDPALALTGTLAAVVVVLDAVGPALYLSLVGIFLPYAAVAVSAAALPAVRPALYRRCRLRLPPAVLAVVSVFGAVAAAAVLRYVVVLDPATTLGVARWAPSLSVVPDAVLVRDPLLTVVPAALLWELVGVVVLAVAADYRAEHDRYRPPLDAAYDE